ncbi:hypothetical protein MCUN1_001904 [Malassezia cuniculi]|uniref:Myosin-binding domain-containing protein n=1 Tax=Malassezia cuniculi TaxID=948313 RepID=A0AAF0JB89_9BASI|nr:hypothetical protein MCUN1_001904 [Malassezia cuniculi]
MPIDASTDVTNDVTADSKPVADPPRVKSLIAAMEAAAWSSDDGVGRFTERFKYVIATSFLLTSSLSVSDYDTPQEEQEHVSVSSSVPEQYTRVEGDISGQVSLLPLLDVGVLGALALCIRIPIRYVLFLVAALFIGLCSQEVSNHLGVTARISYTLRHAPNEHAHRFLANAVPNPAWVADERARLQVAALAGVRKLVHEAHALDRKISEGINAIQEVELVSRGYSLSRPLAPISRIEASTPGRQPDEMTNAPIQRLGKLRAALSRTMDEVDYACRGAQSTLVPLVDDKELGLMQEINSVKTLPSQMDLPDSPRDSRRAVLTPRTSMPPRILSITPQATPQRPQAFRFERVEDLVTPPHPSLRSAPLPSDGNVFAADSSFRGREDGRLTIAALRAQFEAMHDVRRCMLYHFLSLHFMMQSPMPGGLSMSEYWDAVIGVLRSAADQMRSCGDKVSESIAQSMAPDVAAPPVNAEDRLQGHPGLKDRVGEMAHILRAIQCKLHVFGEDLSLGRLKQLHGVRSEPDTPSSEHPRALFDSIRGELLALSTEWEESLRIIDATYNPPAHDEAPATPHTPVSSTPESQSPRVDTPNEDHGPELFSDELEGDSDRLGDDLIDSSPSRLPSPGTEEVFEAVSSKRPARSRLSRAERIKMMREREEEPLENVPQAMISELRGIIAAKHQEREETRNDLLRAFQLSIS